MMKRTLLMLGMVVMLATTASAKKTAPKPALAGANDSVSYALGMSIGVSLLEQFKALPIDSVNAEKFTTAILATLRGDSTKYLIKQKDVNTTINSVMEKAQKEKEAKDLAANKIWMANNKAKWGVTETKSGLQYKVIKMGDGEKPKATDKVKVHYKGTLTDGTVFDSSIDRGQPTEFELNKVIPGWTEGIQLMPVGSKFEFYIPSELAYGNRAMGNIKSNSILIFEVELLDIVKVQPKSTAKFQFQPYQRGM